MQALGRLKRDSVFQRIVPSSSETPKLPFAAVVLSRAVNNLIIQVTSREQGKGDYSFSIYP